MVDIQSFVQTDSRYNKFSEDSFLFKWQTYDYVPHYITTSLLFKKK